MSMLIQWITLKEGNGMYRDHIVLLEKNKEDLRAMKKGMKVRSFDSVIDRLVRIYAATQKDSDFQDRILDQQIHKFFADLNQLGLLDLDIDSDEYYQKHQIVFRLAKNQMSVCRGLIKSIEKKQQIDEDLEEKVPEETEGSVPAE